MANFFKLYQDYTKTKEPPPNFHAWSAIAAISALLGRKCVIPQGHFSVFPNLYIVLVGEPATRKSTAMNVAKGLVRQIATIPTASESGSREGLIDTMAGGKVLATTNGADISYWQSSAFVTEMSEFLGGKHINGSMVSFLTAIWDEPIFRETTRKGGIITIHNPYFTMLGCCTPNWMSTKLKQDVISEGFSRRTIFAMEEDLNLLNPWPESTLEEVQILAELSLEVKRIHLVSGNFTLSKEARVIYDTAYLGNRAAAAGFSDKVKSYFSSKHVLVLKISMCISAGIDSDRKITGPIVTAALAFLTQYERCLDIVFSGIGRNELKGLADQALTRLRKAGENGMTKAQFATACYEDMKMAEIDEVWGELAGAEHTRFVELESAQSVPRMRATILNPLPPGRNLLRMVSEVEMGSEAVTTPNVAFSIADSMSPETTKHLAEVGERKKQVSAGVLIKRQPALVEGLALGLPAGPK